MTEQPILIDHQKIIGVVVCGRDQNRPDLEVCISGPEHQIILKLPFPPCAKPGPSDDKCVVWSVESRKNP